MVFFFANDLLPAVYFIFILDYSNDVRQKSNSSDFFIRVQSNGDDSQHPHFWAGTANKRAAQWGFKLCKGDEGRGHSGRPSEADSN